MVMVVCFTSNDASLQIFLSWLAFTVYTFVRRFFWPYAKHVAAQPESGVFRATAKQMVVLTGWKLNILRWINFLPIVGGAYRSLQRKLLGLDDSVLFRFDFSHQPGTLQSNAAINSLNVIQAAKGAAYDESRLVPIDTNNGAGFRFPDFDAYRTAYMSGKTTPVDVAKRLVDAVAKSTGSGPDCVNAIIRVNAESFLREAEASRLRYVNGTTLSEFDGIPITVKDEFDVEGYRTSAGTEFLNRETLAKKDAVIVQRLRAKGFLIAGKANMMEIGIAPFGYNKFNGHCKSPYDTTCDSGGSSSGSAAAVGSGLVPAALGADGGGSIRVPSAFCGVVGLKANVNRVPECSGVFPLCFSVGHAGPIASNVKDAYAVFRIIQGPHEGDLLSGSVPVGIPRSLNGNTRWRIGVCEEWIALCTDKSISANFRQSLEQLQAAGATIVPFKIPVFEQIRLGHTVTILSEMLATMTPYDGELHHMMGMTNASLAMGKSFSAVSYVQAQKIRSWTLAYFQKLYRDEFDLIVTPTCAQLPPRWHTGVADMAEGISDAEALFAAMTFIFLSNFIGNPAISIPNGYDAASGLPTALHIMADFGCEEDCIAAAAVVEKTVQKKRPKVFFDLL